MTPAVLSRLLRQARHCLMAYDNPNCGMANVKARVDYHRQEDVLEVSIAGTNDELDVLNDFSVRGRDQVGNVSVHRGIKAYAERIDQRLLLKFRELGVFGSPQVELSGHSLGAGAAQYLILRSTWYRDAKCQAALLACPRVFGIGGEGLFLEAGVTCDYLRVEHRGDIVPDLPPWLTGWRHVGKSETIGEAGFFGVFNPIGRHRLTTYIKTLEGMQV